LGRKTEKKEERRKFFNKQPQLEEKRKKRKGQKKHFDCFSNLRALSHQKNEHKS